MIFKDYKLLFFRGFSLVISFLVGVIITRVISVHDRGVYTYFTTWLAIGTVIISGGLPVFILKRSVVRKISSLSLSILKLGIIYSVLFFGILIFSKSSIILKVIIVFVSFLSSIITIIRHYLISKGNLLLNELYLQIPSFFILFIFLLGYLFDINVIYGVYFWIVSNLFILLFFVLYLYNKYKFKILWIKNTKLNLLLFKKSYRYYLVSVMGIFQSKVPYIILAFGVSYENLAYFGVAEVIPSVFLSISSALVNKSAYLIFSNSLSLFDKMSSIVKQIIVFYITILLICFFAGEIIITSIYGSEYHRSSFIIPILLTVSLFSVLNDLLLNLLIQNNKVQYGIFPSLIWLFLLLIVFLFKINTTILLLASLQVIVAIITFLTYGFFVFKTNNLTIESKS